jgi:hypothetical protein
MRGEGLVYAGKKDEAKKQFARFIFWVCHHPNKPNPQRSERG